MGRKKGIYERIAKARGLATTLNSLWLAPDHLLYIENDGYTENYRRFYLRDIEAFICRQTRRWHLWTVLFLTLMSLSLIGAVPAFTTGDAVTQSISGFFAGFFILCVFANLVLGPSCVCLVQTAVQREKLRPITRMKQAMKVLDQLGAAVKAVQGDLPVEELERSNSVLADGPEGLLRSAATRRAPGLAGIRPTRMYKGHAHEILVVALLAHLVAACLRSLFTGVVPLSLNIVVWPLLIVVPFIAVVRQHKTILPGVLKAITWFTMAYCAFQGSAVALSQTMYAAAHRDLQYGIFGYAQAMSEISAWDAGEVGFRVVSAILFASVTGTTGLIVLRRFRKATGAPPPLPLP